MPRGPTVLPVVSPSSVPPYCVYLVPWNVCILGIRKCVSGTLPPGIQLGHYNVIKSGFGSFHVGFDVKSFHYTEMCYKWIYETALKTIAEFPAGMHSKVTVCLSLHHIALCERLK